MKVGPLDAGAAIRVRAKDDDSAPSISAAVLAFLGEPEAHEHFRFGLDPNLGQ